MIYKRGPRPRFDQYEDWSCDHHFVPSTFYLICSEFNAVSNKQALIV